MLPRRRRQVSLSFSVALNKGRTQEIGKIRRPDNSISYLKHEGCVNPAFTLYSSVGVKKTKQNKQQQQRLHRPDLERRSPRASRTWTQRRWSSTGPAKSLKGGRWRRWRLQIQVEHLGWREECRVLHLPSGWVCESRWSGRSWSWVLDKHSQDIFRNIHLNKQAKYKKKNQN